MSLEDLYRELKPAPWMASAACRGADTNLWFPTRNTKQTTTDKAIRICNRCPVQTECAQYGRDETRGIWGGQRNYHYRKGHAA